MGNTYLRLFINTWIWLFRVWHISKNFFGTVKTGAQYRQYINLTTIFSTFRRLLYDVWGWRSKTLWNTISYRFCCQWAYFSVRLNTADMLWIVLCSLLDAEHVIWQINSNTAMSSTDSSHSQRILFSPLLIPSNGLDQIYLGTYCYPFVPVTVHTKAAHCE